jgi:hypothetical protein
MTVRRRGRVHAAAPRSAADLARLTPAELAAELHHHLGLPTRPEPGDLLLLPSGFAAPTTTDTVALGLALARIGGVIAPRVHHGLRASLLTAGIPVLEGAEPAAGLAAGDEAIIDFGTGAVENVTRHRMLVGDGLYPHEVALARDAPALTWYGAAADDPDVEDLSPPAAPAGPATIQNG